MATIKIDDKEYDVDTLSDEVKAQLASIQAVDKRLTQVREETAILQTARSAYANALKGLLPDAE